MTSKDGPKTFIGVHASFDARVFVGTLEDAVDGIQTSVWFPDSMPDAEAAMAIMLLAALLGILTAPFITLLTLILSDDVVVMKLVLWRKQLCT